MPLFDRCGIPRGERLQLLVYPGNGRVLPDTRQLDQAAREIVAALAVLCLLRRVEIIPCHDIDWLLQQGQISQPVLVVVIDGCRVFSGPLLPQLYGWRVRQNVLNFEAGVRLQAAGDFTPLNAMSTCWVNRANR